MLMVVELQWDWTDFYPDFWNDIILLLYLVCQGGAVNQSMESKHVMLDNLTKHLIHMS